MESLLTSVSDLSALYQRTGAGTEEQRDAEQQALSSSSDTPSVFVSQLDLDHYHKSEEKFTQELTAFTKKQFFQVCVLVALFQMHYFKSGCFYALFFVDILLSFKLHLFISKQASIYIQSFK